MSNTLNKMKGGSSYRKSHSMKKTRKSHSKKPKSGKMHGGSCASNHVNKAITGGCWTCGGKKKTMKKRGTKSSMKSVMSSKRKTKKRSMKRKMRGGNKHAHKMNGGGVNNIHQGCGFVNTDDINRHGCDVAAIKNPNLGPISSGLASLGM